MWMKYMYQLHNLHIQLQNPVEAANTLLLAAKYDWKHKNRLEAFEVGGWCEETLEERQANLSRKLARAATLLRTRVDVELQEQARGQLEAMNRRARLQLRLQQTVEGLSVAAVSYYVVGLIAYLAKGAKAGPLKGLLPGPETLTALAVPVVLVVVFLTVRRIRRHHGEADGEG